MLLGFVRKILINAKRYRTREITSVELYKNGCDEERPVNNEELEKLEIETRPVLTGNFLAQPAIQRITRHAIDPLRFVNATKVTSEAFMVGAHHDLTEYQINFLCQSLSEVGKL